MRRIEVFNWRIRHGDGRETFTHMSLEDGRALGAEMLQGSDVLIDVPETNDELIESWMSGETFRVVSGPVQLRMAA